MGAGGLHNGFLAGVASLACTRGLGGRGLRVTGAWGLGSAAVLGLAPWLCKGQINVFILKFELCYVIVTRR